MRKMQNAGLLDCESALNPQSWAVVHKKRARGFRIYILNYSRQEDFLLHKKKFGLNFKSRIGL